MNQQLERYLQMVLLVLDLIVLNLCYIFCFAIFNKNLGLFHDNAYVLFWTISNVLWITLSFMMRTYSEKIILSFEYFTKRTILVYLFWIIFIMFYLFFSRELEISRLFIVSTIGSFGFGLLVNRFIYLGLNGYLKKERLPYKESTHTRL